MHGLSGRWPVAEYWKVLSYATLIWDLGRVKALQPVSVASALWQT
jgi:hypothetical protein